MSARTSPGTGSRLIRMARGASRVLLGSALVGAGIAHLTSHREEFQAQVPDWMPVDHDLVVLGSGVIEIGLGGSLILSPSAIRPVIGLATAGFFVVIFPGNFAQYVEGTDAFGLESDRARLARLFFQPVLILWALESTDVRRWWRARRQRSTRP
ncbi:DoxX family protein [Nesterenkonia aerolata]|uniref:DoxX family membrane protein n=1 Tax=Nesterenkonia aerolata TaxID=3074079 RepID=A0ABU2DSE3_9MICC|nr:hypothetical protein [Nesterenkonia sp. LY-0111]MDR8019426.1 hypothetical protein [Nesterenkonia sp. LY-0111]